MKVRELTARLEQFAPKHLAMDGDPIGIQLGSLESEVSKVLITLDVRPNVVEEAIDVGADFIVAHHPVMFRPVKNMDLSVTQNAMYAKIIENHITVYAAHTNLDNADDGMNDWISNELKLVNLLGLVPAKMETEYLLTVHVASTYLDMVRMAIAGNENKFHKGPSYEWNSTTRWSLPLSSAVIEPRRSSHTNNEVSIQFRINDSHVSSVIKAINNVLPNSSYPNFELVALKDASKTYYMGRVGDLQNPMTTREFANYCKIIFGVTGLRLVSSNQKKMIRRVAVVGGDGGRFYTDAIAAGADAYVTGDVYYHTGHDMLTNGLTVIDPGHYIEQICKPKLMELFENWKIENKWPIEIVSSSVNTNPFTFI